MIISRAKAIEMGVLDGKLPKLSDIRHFLRYNIHVTCRHKVIDALIVGSTAKGSHKPGSDIDIAIIIPTMTKSSLKFTEQYHAKFMTDDQKPHWHGRILDFQFFYENDLYLNEYHRIELST